MYQYSNSLIRQFPSLVTGNAAVGVQATVYVGETGALASLFEVNGSPKSNPVTTDAKGFYSFSLADGDYRIVFSSSQFATLRISVLDGAQIREEFDDLVASNVAFRNEQQAAYDAFVLSQGWDQVGTFAVGFTFTSPNQVGQDDDGNWWRWNGSLPKTVTAGTLPSSDPNYKLVGDGVLRSDLAASGSEALIAGQQAKKYFATFDTVAEMQSAITSDYVGRRVQWLGYHALSDGGSGWGIVKSGAYTPDGGSIIAAGVGLYIEQNLKGNKVSALKFGAKFDNLTASSAANTTALQNWLTYIGINSRHGSLPDGVAYHNGLTSVHSTRISGVKTEGPEFGVRTDYKGSVLRNNSTANTSITVDATVLPVNTGLSCVWDNFTLYGNRNVVGSTAGYNVLLKADNAGEATFIESSLFTNVQCIYSKQDNWAIQGTVFANDWYNCSGSYGAGHGATRIDPAGGNPVTNNFHNCKFFENELWGFYNNGMKSILNSCNISQNKVGGVLQRSGYMELNHCDYEGNENVSIELRDSSASTLIVGGMIHKTPGTKPGWVGVRAAAGTAGAVMKGTLFANFDAAGDKIFESTGGGSFEEFDFRRQNVPATAFDNTARNSIGRIPNESSSVKVNRGIATFTGSGVGQRVAFIVFDDVFLQDYVVTTSLDSSGGVNTPDKVQVSVDYDTFALNTIRLRCTVVDASIDTVLARWVAIGN